MGKHRPVTPIQGADTMTKLAIKGLLAITTALWLPAHGAGNTAPWLPESQKENRHDDSGDSETEEHRVWRLQKHMQEKAARGHYDHY